MGFVMIFPNINPISLNFSARLLLKSNKQQIVAHVYIFTMISCCTSSTFIPDHNLNNKVFDAVTCGHINQGLTVEFPFCPFQLHQQNVRFLNCWPFHGLFCFSVDDVQLSCYRILTCFYSLGTGKNIFVERWEVTEVKLVLFLLLIIIGILPSQWFPGSNV